ncbi:hypothetical protein CASFOL_030666 [Castilleja foliolosa]|uniref:Protein APEM9 n=1 Tax=Castilleja foliolosa TaxID=1961234 RepID=A0ABD3C6L9_9LAMI
MEIIDEQTSIWEEIDRAENYLVCLMFDEAAELASSILKRLLEIRNRSNDCEISENFENEWDDMLESAGMVFVQSLNQLLRTSELLKELKLLFGSLNAVPVQVFVTCVCFQMSEGLLTGVQSSLEEFLNSWIFMDDRYYPLSGADDSVSDTEQSSFMLSVGVDEYLEVVELYVITFLATTLKDTDVAISWVENAKLPVEKRQELLRRLQSMNSSNVTTSSQTSVPSQLANDFSEHHQKDIESKSLSHGVNITAKDEILKLSRQRVPCFWWFRTIRLKLGNTELVLPSGKLLLAALLVLMYYITRKKQAALKRLVTEKAGSIKKALLDLWQLAFAYQVNPLAAVQSLPTAAR